MNQRIINEYSTFMENLFDLITKLVDRRPVYAEKFKNIRDEIIKNFK